MNTSPLSGSFPSYSAPSSQPSNGIKPLKYKPMKRKPNPNHASVFKSSAIPPCTECGKQFNSWKALFGHMRCHPERQWRGMNMKQKPKPKLHVEVEQTSNWDHITDEPTKAALILMEMSGQSVGYIVDCLKRGFKEEVGKACTDLNSPLIDAEKEFSKLEKPLPDLNLAPPIEY